MKHPTSYMVCIFAALATRAAHAADYTIQAGSTGRSIVFLLPPENSNPSSAIYIREPDTPSSNFLSTAHTNPNDGYSSGKYYVYTGNGWGALARLDLPNAAIDTGKPHVDIFVTCDAGGRVLLNIDLIGYDPTAANLPANVTQWLNQGVEGPDQNGVPKVDVAYVEGNGLGTHVSGYFPSDVRQWRSNAVPAAHANGYPIVTVKDGTGTGEIDTFNGLVSLTPASKKALGWIFSGVVDTVTNATTYITTDTNGEVAPPGSLVVFLDASNGNRPSVRRVITNDSAGNLTIDSAPDFTVATNDGVEFIATPTQLPAAAPGAAGGLFIAGANAATTVNITGNITGDLSGSVGSVSGDVGGNVVGSVGSISGVTFPANFGGMTITSGRVNADVTHWLTAPVATPNQAGTPTVDITHVLGSPVCD